MIDFYYCETTPDSISDGPLYEEQTWPDEDEREPTYEEREQWIEDRSREVTDNVLEALADIGRSMDTLRELPMFKEQAE